VRPPPDGSVGIVDHSPLSRLNQSAMTLAAEEILHLEPLIRLSVFLGIFALMALWE
jgi:hypothetical protein